MSESKTTPWTVERIQELCQRHIERTPRLPCAVTEMTQREYEIFGVLCYHNGFINFLRMNLP